MLLVVSQQQWKPVIPTCLCNYTCLKYESGVPSFSWLFGIQASHHEARALLKCPSERLTLQLSIKELKLNTASDSWKSFRALNVESFGLNCL